MKSVTVIRKLNPRLVVLCLGLVWIACACTSTPTPVPIRLPTHPIATNTPQFTPSPMAMASPTPIPQIPGLVPQTEFDAQHKLLAVHYRNSSGMEIALFDPTDTVHNHRLSWRWENMSALERDQTLRWLFDPLQMRYSQFGNQEEHFINTLAKWIPRLNDFAVPTDPSVAIHWQSDGPPMNQDTLYEALSRVKTLALVRERRLCSYGHSQLGLIEYGGEIVLFTAPEWEKVSGETREILTTVWTVKEAMVIYYPQSQGWASSCPGETEQLKVEYYSTIWLLKAEQTLAQFVPADASYWNDQEMLRQSRNISTQSFPRCQPPVLLADPTLNSDNGWDLP